MDILTNIKTFTLGLLSWVTTVVLSSLDAITNKYLIVNYDWNFADLPEILIEPDSSTSAPDASTPAMQPELIVLSDHQKLEEIKRLPKANDDLDLAKENKRLLNELKEKPIGSAHQLDVNKASAADEFDQLEEIPPPISNDPVGTTNMPAASCSEKEAAGYQAGKVSIDFK
ncbi:hypothetical protein DAPPUDRAFT_261702 [Daphnia pulex]|uniref:Uncharacterized protein n=1 Tax=Daphnia pulex TaxID=6669 RepID=E9HLH9_DAPPU|nr:hypothetical protein DAPPUDRAFT_261702 [Daphnia pulex]|eukprot:EFX67352.1 hypothetical protein DAPPUDRAFT_261702 [Daphnia pulex]